MFIPYVNKEKNIRVGEGSVYYTYYGCLQETNDWPCIEGLV